MKNKDQRGRAAVEKELNTVRKQEEFLRRTAERSENPRWKQELESKVPEKVYGSLQKAFCKAFSVIFTKGTWVIEKSYDRDEIQEDHEIQSFAFQMKASRKTLKKVRGSAGRTNVLNLAMTAAEGIGLGALGIGLPDIVIFVGVLLRGVYETALHYGFDYNSLEERYFILKLMETAMLKKDDWIAGNEEIDRLIAGERLEERSQNDIDRQIIQTADTFAADMILLKFIQGLPVAGIIGGAGNPLYYKRVMRYVELKYRKRYLLDLQRNQITSVKRENGRDKMTE